MFENYTYKFKFKVLIGLIVILSITAYKRSFSVLIFNYNQYVDLKETILSAKKNALNIDELQRKLQLVNSNLGNGKEKSATVQQDLISFGTSSEYNVSLYSVKPIHLFEDQKYFVNTFNIDLTGDYNNLVKLMHSYETKFENSKIVSAEFQLQKKSKMEQLHLNLIFQNYESK